MPRISTLRCWTSTADGVGAAGGCSPQAASFNLFIHAQGVSALRSHMPASGEGERSLAI
jgi:hypothetical protein